jgi:hypothetical protein
MRTLFVFWLTFLALGAGCGRDASRGALGGQVTLDGRPLEDGSILLTPMEGTRGVVVGGPIERGRYRLAGDASPAVGWNRVEIRAMRKTGHMVPKPFSPRGSTETIEQRVEAAPPRFNSASTLKVDVKPGENVADFAVSSIDR